MADVYDALTSKRAYKDSMNPADAIEYIMANVKLDSGTVVDLMNKLDITILQILNT